jgi:hypothetical protein
MACDPKERERDMEDFEGLVEEPAYPDPIPEYSREEEMQYFEEMEGERPYRVYRRIVSGSLLRAFRGSTCHN